MLCHANDDADGLFVLYRGGLFEEPAAAVAALELGYAMTVTTYENHDDSLMRCRTRAS